MTSKVTNDPVNATYSLNVATTLPGKQETMKKATVRPRRIGWLASHHYANSVVTTGTVASCHTMLRCRHKTMMTTMPRCYRWQKGDVGATDT
jgi:adenylosuccinate synthase